MYANTNQGLLIVAPPLHQRHHQQHRLPAGRRRDQAAEFTRCPAGNNILWVNAGYDLNVDAPSQVGFDSDYNLFNKSVDPNAHIGFWGSVKNLLADWTTATNRDGNSLFGDPKFVDINGADDVLGYTAAGGGFNGGNDDNFELSAGSPAIDRADGWSAPATDITGAARFDDPGTTNAGSPDYATSPTSVTVYQSAAPGVAQNWHGNNTYWNLPFPTGFNFPFYGVNHTSVYVSSEGFLDFGTANLGDAPTPRPSCSVARGSCPDGRTSAQRHRERHLR